MGFNTSRPREVGELNWSLMDQACALEAQGFACACGTLISPVDCSRGCWTPKTFFLTCRASSCHIPTHSASWVLVCFSAVARSFTCGCKGGLVEKRIFLVVTSGLSLALLRDFTYSQVVQVAWHAQWPRVQS